MIWEHFVKRDSAASSIDEKRSYFLLARKELHVVKWNVLGYMYCFSSYIKVKYHELKNFWRKSIFCYLHSLSPSSQVSLSFYLLSNSLTHPLTLWHCFFFSIAFLYYLCHDSSLSPSPVLFFCSLSLVLRFVLNITFNFIMFICTIPIITVHVARCFIQSKCFKIALWCVPDLK